MNVLAEIKRGPFFRMTGLYLGGAGLSAKMAAAVLPILVATDWIGRSEGLILPIGLIPALMFAWIFDLTPQSVRRGDEVETGRSIAPQTDLSLDRVCGQHDGSVTRLRSVPFFAGLRDDSRFLTWVKCVEVPE